MITWGIYTLLISQEEDKDMKREIMMVVLAVLAVGSVFAGYPVIDIHNIIASIENGYTLVQQLQAMYENVRNGIEQLNETRKNFEAFDVRQLSLKDPLGSWGKIMTYGNRMMTYEENMEAVINKKNLKIGNSSYSLADLFTSPSTIPDVIGDGIGFVAVDPFSKKLTPEEQAIFHSKYGMSYGHYLRIHTLGTKIGEKAAELTGYSGSLEENLKEDRDALSKMINEVSDGNSIVEQAQVTNAQLAAQCQELKSQTSLLSKLGEEIASESARNQLLKQAMEDSKKNSDLDVADGYLKMLDNMGKRGDFKGHLYPIN
jgi:conjugal transfer/entry exclusion protein